MAPRVAARDVSQGEPAGKITRVPVTAHARGDKDVAQKVLPMCFRIPGISFAVIGGQWVHVREMSAGC